MNNQIIENLSKWYQSFDLDPSSNMDSVMNLQVTDDLEQVYLSLLQARIHIFSNNFDSLDKLKTRLFSLEEFVKSSNAFLQIDFYTILGLIDHKQANFDAAFESLIKAEAAFYKYTGSNSDYSNLEPFTEYLEDYNNYFAITKKSIFDLCLALYSALLRVGTVSGQFQNADKYSLKLKQVFDQAQTDIEPANYLSHQSTHSLSSMLGSALYNRQKGYYNVASKLYFDILKEFEEDLDLQKRGLIYGNLGSLYFDLGNYDESLEYCNEALKLFKTDTEKYFIYIIQIQVLIILNFVEHENLTSATKICEQLEGVNDELPVIMHLKGLAKGASLSVLEDNQEALNDAENILQKLVDDDIVDFEVTKKANDYLCKLLYNKLNMSYDISTMEKLEKYTNLIYEWGVTKNINQYIMDGIMYKSNIEKIKGMKN